jgi:hypothetical protein
LCFVQLSGVAQVFFVRAAPLALHGYALHCRNEDCCRWRTLHLSTQPATPAPPGSLLHTTDTTALIVSLLLRLTDTLVMLFRYFTWCEYDESTSLSSPRMLGSLSPLHRKAHFEHSGRIRATTPTVVVAIGLRQRQTKTRC